MESNAENINTGAEKPRNFKQELVSLDEDRNIPERVRVRLLEILRYYKDEGHLVAISASGHAESIASKSVVGDRTFWITNVELNINGQSEELQIEIWEDTGQVRGRLPKFYVHPDEK